MKIQESSGPETFSKGKHIYKDTHQRSYLKLWIRKTLLKNIFTLKTKYSGPTGTLALGNIFTKTNETHLQKSTIVDPLREKNIHKLINSLLKA